MCIVCIHWNKLTPKERDSALSELVRDYDELDEYEFLHFQEVSERIGEEQ
jgi:hypothetical protein